MIDPQWTELIASLLGVYEVIARIIPSKKILSIIGNILNIMHKISETLDRRK